MSVIGWAIIELMGHRRLAGYVQEVEVAGQGMLRLDVPDHPWRNGCTCGSADPESLDHEKHNHTCQMFRADDDLEPRDVIATQFYSPSALYCLTPTTEEIARGLAQRAKPAPVARYELPAPPAPTTANPEGTGTPACDDCGHLLSDHDDHDPELGTSACSVEGCECQDYEGIPF